MLGSKSEGFWWFCNVVGCSHSLRRQSRCQSWLNGTEWSSSPHVAAFLSFRMTMPPLTEHMRSPNGLMSMTLMLSICHGFLSHHIWTQLSIYGDILEWCLRQSFPPPPNRCKLIDYLVEEWCHIPPAEFQTPVDSMPWRIQAVLSARGDPMPY